MVWVAQVVQVFKVGFDVPLFEAAGWIHSGATALARRSKPGWFEFSDSLGGIGR